jgi:hypothetical protein
MPIHAVRPAAAEGDPHRLVGLHVQDVSRGGVGAVSQEDLGHKEPLLLFFPPLGPGKGRDMAGRVVRCHRSGDRYTVGIAFEEPWPDREEAWAP